MAPVTDGDQHHARDSLTNLSIPPAGSAAKAATHVDAVPDEETEPAHPSAAAVTCIESRLHYRHGHGDDNNDNNDDDHDDASLRTPVEPISSAASSFLITSPPYWVNPNAKVFGRKEPAHDAALPAGAIALRDNDTEDDDRNSACWAKSVEIVNYTLVRGSAIPSGLSAFVVWNIRIETLNGTFLNIRKRYSEFDEFRGRLVATFPGFKAAMPRLPPKSLVYKLKPEFLEKRRTGLEYFLNCILLNPEFSGSPVLKDFLFA